MSKKPSPTMNDLLEQMKLNGGEVHRYPGGYWRVGGADSKAWWGTQTIKAMVLRGTLEFLESRHGFPVAARIKPPQP